MPSRADHSRDGLYCLIGGDVHSSPSPAMMNAAFSKLSIDAHYIAMSVSDGELATWFAQLRKEGYRGMNVTIPFKSAIIPLLDGLDAVAAKIVAVNTVKNDGGRFMGYNTDVEGIVRPLEKLCAVGEIREAVLVGTGGAGRAFIEALHRLGCTRVSVLVRDESRASSFVREMKSKFTAMEITLHSLAESHALRSSSVQLLFNASPIGSRGIPLPKSVRDLALRASMVFDAVYRPMRTELISTAESAGARVIYGYEMLLHQGGAAFELWTGRKAPFDVMELEVLQSLEASVG